MHFLGNNTDVFGSFGLHRSHKDFMVENCGFEDFRVW